MTGRRIANLGQRVETISNHLNFKAHSPGQVRRSVVTHAAKTMPTEKCALVTQQLSHSIEVERKHYLLTQNFDQATTAYHLIHGGEQGSSSTAEKEPAVIRKVSFSYKETTAIEEYVQVDIEQGKGVTPKKAKAFLAQNEWMKRTGIVIINECTLSDEVLLLHQLVHSLNCIFVKLNTKITTVFKRMYSDVLCST